MKIKLFTHTDLDGIGCAILMKNVYRNDKIDIEYCDYGNVNDKIGSFLNKKDYIEYDKIFITDISINEDIANIIDELSCMKEFILLDHHKTAEWLNRFDWAKIEDYCSVFGIKTSGTFMLHKWLIENNEKYVKCNYSNSKDFVQLVNDYDTRPLS